MMDKRTNELQGTKSEPGLVSDCVLPLSVHCLNHKNQVVLLHT